MFENRTWFFWIILILISIFFGHVPPVFPIAKFIDCHFPIIIACNANQPVDIERIQAHLAEGSLRLEFSVVVFVVVLGTITTIPMYVYKCFENTRFYKFYKLFWLFAAIVCARLFVLLYYQKTLSSIKDIFVSKIPNLFSWHVFVSVVIAVLILTLLPAAYQYHKKRGNQAVLFRYKALTVFYVIGSAAQYFNHLYGFGY